MEHHFHYYGTLLAGLTAGLGLRQAQSLAYYCYGTYQQSANTPSTRHWHYEQYLFTPVITRKGHSSQAFGEKNCALAFEAFPAMEEEPVKNEPVHDFTQEQHGLSESCYASKVDRARSCNRVQCFYNPLTDIDWQGGGDLKAHFRHKLASKAQLLEKKSAPQANRATIKGEVHGPQENPLPYQLRPKKNSSFMHKAINDLIFKQSYHDLVRSEPLPLLGCRLFSLQSSWKENGVIEDKLDAWLWTLQSIICFLEKRPLKDRASWGAFIQESENTFVFSALQSLLHHKKPQEVTQQEWLNLIIEVIESKATPLCHEVMQYGLALRESHLIDQAHEAAQSVSPFEIRDLSKFKRTALFKLNKAAQYHCDWLARQLACHGFSAFNTQQSIGNLDMWR